VKKIFWSVLVAVAGLALTRVFDPATAQQLVQIISGIYDLKTKFNFFFELRG